jgi:hypothetical protein
VTYQSTTFDTIRKSAFKNVRTALASVHTDISTRIYGSYPLADVVLPLIVVRNGNTQSVNENSTLTSLNTRLITVIVEIYAKQAEKIDTYADAVDAAIRTAKSTFATYKMILQNNGVEDNGEVSFYDAQNNRTHMKSISLTFEVDA